MSMGRQVLRGGTRRRGCLLSKKGQLHRCKESNDSDLKEMGIARTSREYHESKLIYPLIVSMMG
jgi:hypothetical protein